MARRYDGISTVYTKKNPDGSKTYNWGIGDGSKSSIVYEVISFIIVLPFALVLLRYALPSAIIAFLLFLEMLGM